MLDGLTAIERMGDGGSSRAGHMQEDQVAAARLGQDPRPQRAHHGRDVMEALENIFLVIDPEQQAVDLLGIRDT